MSDDREEFDSLNSGYNQDRDMDNNGIPDNQQPEPPESPDGVKSGRESSETETEFHPIVISPEMMDTSQQESEQRNDAAFLVGTYSPSAGDSRSDPERESVATMNSMVRQSEMALDAETKKGRVDPDHILALTLNDQRFRMTSTKRQHSVAALMSNAAAINSRDPSKSGLEVLKNFGKGFSMGWKQARARALAIETLKNNQLAQLVQHAHRHGLSDKALEAIEDLSKGYTARFFNQEAAQGAAATQPAPEQPEQTAPSAPGRDGPEPGPGGGEGGNEPGGGPGGAGPTPNGPETPDQGGGPAPKDPDEPTPGGSGGRGPDGPSPSQAEAAHEQAEAQPTTPETASPDQAAKEAPQPEAGEKPAAQAAAQDAASQSAAMDEPVPFSTADKGEGREQAPNRADPSYGQQAAEEAEAARRAEQEAQAEAARQAQARAEAQAADAGDANATKSGGDKPRAEQAAPERDQSAQASDTSAQLRTFQEPWPFNAPLVDKVARDPQQASTENLIDAYAAARGEHLMLQRAETRIRAAASGVPEKDLSKLSFAQQRELTKVGLPKPQIDRMAELRTQTGAIAGQLKARGFPTAELDRQIHAKTAKLPVVIPGLDGAKLLKQAAAANKASRAKAAARPAALTGDIKLGPIASKATPPVSPTSMRGAAEPAVKVFRQVRGAVDQALGVNRDGPGQGR